MLRGSRWGQTFPFVPGYDIAGVVESIGEGVSGFNCGDRVFCVNWGVGKHNGDDVPYVGGGFAEYSVVNASKISKIPTSVRFEEAAAVALAGTTAYQSLFEKLKVSKGRKVLILGASGAVGQIGVQLANNVGAKVLATCSSRARNFVSRFHPYKIIDYTTSDWSADPDVCDGQLDAIFDTVGTPGTFAKAKSVLRPGGSFLSLTGGEAGTDPMAHPPLAYASLYCLRNDPVHQDILVAMIADKSLEVVIDEEFSFTKEGVENIFRKVGAGKSLGKNILRIA